MRIATMPNSSPDHSILRLEQLLAQFRDGQENAPQELVEYALRHFRRLVQKMRGDFERRLGGLVETDDVFQASAMRLQNALFKIAPEKRPGDALAFRRLFALQVRRELLELVRQFYRPHKAGAHQHVPLGAAGNSSRQPGLDVPGPTSAGPERIAQFAELHEKAGQLPEELRLVFDLIYYNGMTQIEAAEELGVPKSTVGLRWRQAQLELRRLLHGTHSPQSLP